MATQNAIDSQDPIQVSLGGQGNSTLTNHGVLVGAGTSAITQLAVGTSGQLLIAATAADPAFATLTSTASSITYTTGAHTLNLDVANWVAYTATTYGVAFGGGTTGITYNSGNSNGMYFRMGSMVYVAGQVALSNKGSSTGQATITGLPYTSNSANLFFFTVQFQNINTLTSAVTYGFSNNSTTIQIKMQSTTTGNITLDNTFFTNTTQVNFSGWYSL